jgi:protein-tyrosine phosphatase
MKANAKEKDRQVQLESHPIKTKATRRPEINRGRHIRFTDIHAHILPGIDDGAADMDETLKMVSIAYDEGIRTMICTPHYSSGQLNMSIPHLRSLFDEVTKKVKRAFPEFRLMLGQEIHYQDSVLKKLRDGEILTLNNTTFCLIEFNNMAPYETIFQAVRTLTASGYRPIIAHVERYQCLYRQENLWYQLIRTGAYTQMNFDSIPGNMFDRHNFYCLKMIENGLVHFLGTNCHNAIYRKPQIKPALHVLDKKIDKNTINRITLENGQKMLDNLDI